MTEELQRYYEARFSMFATEGWADLIADIQAMRNATDTIAGLKDLHALGVRQGEVSIMDWMLTLKQMSETAYKELTDENIA